MAVIKPKNPTKTCLCGCGEPVTSFYRQGHDQRHVGAVAARLRAGEGASALQELGTDRLREKAQAMAARPARTTKKAATAPAYVFGTVHKGAGRHYPARRSATGIEINQKLDGSGAWVAATDKQAKQFKPKAGS